MILLKISKNLTRGNVLPSLASEIQLILAQIRNGEKIIARSLTIYEKNTIQIMRENALKMTEIVKCHIRNMYQIP